MDHGASVWRQPAPSWSAAPLFLGEAAGMGVIVFTVGYLLSVRRLAPFVPWLVYRLELCPIAEVNSGIARFRLLPI